MKFLSTEQKFDIFIMNITGKNTFLNSKNTLVSAVGYFGPSWFGPELFQFVDLFSLNRRRGKQKLTSFRVHFFLKFISKTKKSTVQSVIQFRTCFSQIF